MNSEYIITKDQIRSINDQYGGSLRFDADIDAALMRGKGKSLYRKIAYLWRAMLVGHPFTDGNKRTALVVALAILEECDVKLDDGKKEMMVNEITKIAKDNISDVNRIERLVRYVVTGD